MSDDTKSVGYYVDQLEASLRQRNATCRNLRESLAKYGCHLRGCAMVKVYREPPPGEPVCDCGFAAALLATAKPTPAPEIRARLTEETKP